MRSDKIIFFHMNQLGDLLFSMPALKAAKEKDGMKVVSVVKSSFAPILFSSGLADVVIAKENSVFKTVKNIKKEKCSKAILFSESPKMLMTVFLSSIKERIGFKTASLSFLLTKKAPKKGVPSLFNNKNLASVAGLENIKDDYTDIIKIPRENINNVEKWFSANKIDNKKTIAVSTGASKKRRDKCLSNKVWSEIIDALAEAGYDCVLAGAPWEKQSMNETASLCKIKPAVFAAEGGILDSAAFFSKCFMFVGTDSGAMHLAAALKTKCAGIFINTDPSQIGPMPLKNHLIIQKKPSSDILSKDVSDAVLGYIRNQNINIVK